MIWAMSLYLWLIDAYISAVSPLLLCKVALAPACNSYYTMLLCPCVAAFMRGVSPPSVFKSILAPP